jgi:hypothetical protein
MLCAVARHLQATGSAGASVGAAASAAEPKLLTDEQMRRFIAQGYLTLRIAELGDDFHEALYEHARAEFGPNNNGLTGTGGSTDRIPELLAMVNSPTVVGALTSIIGPDYSGGRLEPTPGCALHVSTDEDQIFHKDTQRGVIKEHRTRDVMVMYYPGGADENMGPTAIAPSSHILGRDGLGLSFGVTEEGSEAEADRSDWSGLGAGRAEVLGDIAPKLFEHKVIVPPSAAGTICIIHSAMVHRATNRLSEDARWRPMFKFGFTRTHEPRSPSWAYDPSGNTAAGEAGWPGLVVPEAAPICDSVWRWHLGQVSEPVEAKTTTDIAALRATILADPCAGDEGLRIGAAYSLGRTAQDPLSLPLIVLCKRCAWPVLAEIMIRGGRRVWRHHCPGHFGRCAAL